MQKTAWFCCSFSSGNRLSGILFLPWMEKHMNPSGQAVHMAWNSGMQLYRQTQKESGCVHTNALQMISCQVPDWTAPGVQSSHFSHKQAFSWKHFYCLHTEPDGPAFQKAPAFTFLYKSSFTGLEEAAAGQYHSFTGLWQEFRKIFFSIWKNPGIQWIRPVTAFIRYIQVCLFIHMQW